MRGVNINTKGYHIYKRDSDGRLHQFINRPNAARRRALRAQGWNVSPLRQQRTR